MNDQIKIIYEAMADKTLSFGCTVRTVSDENELIYNVSNQDLYHLRFENGFTHKHYGNFKKPIGHPVMIGDVLTYWEADTEEYYADMLQDYDIEKVTRIMDEDRNKILRKWKKLNKPIEAQSRECIDFVESLLPKE